MGKFRICASGLGLGAMAVLASPAFAQPPGGDAALKPIPLADRLTLSGVFAHASIPMKAVVWGLVAAALAAVATWLLQVVRIRQGRSNGTAGAIAYLSAQAAAAPMFGLFGMAYALLNGFIGIANVRPTPSLTVLAPGLAEASLSLGLGLLAAAIAVVGDRHLRARLRRLDRPEPAAARPAPPISDPARAVA
ncbi:MotA/TolQ/ExbB proton channel family protein [Phenylobacterium sp.]|uniref:MotA/TolQ/ExbB proton channel family protein n=1 Tax=Phenylobacterium sp. TaxID=1871053 RepID=UPI002F3F161F